MTDTVLSPTGSELYEIWLKPDLEVLGTIRHLLLNRNPGF
jgi:hypothetical protein